MGSLTPGETCNLSVVFAPTTVGGANGAINFADNSVNAPRGVNALSVTGLGVANSGTTPQTITSGALPDVTYGVAPIRLNVSTSSSLTPALTVTGPATLNGSTLTITAAGIVTVTANQYGNATYAQATAITQSFTVAQAMLTATASSLTRMYGVANPLLRTRLPAL